MTFAIKNDLFAQNNKGDTMKNKLFLDLSDSIFKNNGYKLEESIKNDIKTSFFEVNTSNKQQLKRDTGKYFTISFKDETLNNYSKYLQKEIIRVLKYFKKAINNYGTTLIIGLGNSSVICDALGPKTTNKVIATNHYVDFLTIPKVALFVPEVIGKTGISSFALIKMLVNSLHPSSIIVIDSLSTNNPKRLNRCIEISNTGIIPGSAIKTNRKISSKTFNIPLISIGVPVVIEVNKQMYTSLNINEEIEKLSSVIGNALNELFLK